MAKAFVFSVEALACLLVIAWLASFFSVQAFDSKKDFLRSQLAEDFAEASVKSNAFEKVARFDLAAGEWLAGFYLKAANMTGVDCVRFGFDALAETGRCRETSSFFTASRSVFVEGKWKAYRIVLGFK